MVVSPDRHKTDSLALRFLFFGRVLDDAPAVFEDPDLVVGLDTGYVFGMVLGFFLAAASSSKIFRFNLEFSAASEVVGLEDIVQLSC